MTVRLITGPPGAGKNTYVTERFKDGDFVVDFDEIRQTHPHLSLDELKLIRNGMEEVAKGFKGDAWVIRCVADPKKRTELAESLSASEVVVLETPADVAKKRVTDRKRNPEKNEEVFAAIDDWWSQYGVVESDLIVKPDTGSSPSDRKQTMADTEHISGTETDKGFPAETKIVDMKPEEQAAYWKFQSRKHEGNATTLKAQLDAKAEKPNVEPKPSAPEAGAPIDPAELRKQIIAELKKEQAPELVRSQFEALIGDRIPADRRDSILEDVNFSNFVKEDGSIDKDRIKTKAELLAPAVNDAPNARQQRQVRSHQGNRRTDGKASVSTGKTLFEEFSKKKG
jgi:predicted kinase